jgi:hypothetical protein
MEDWIWHTILPLIAYVTLLVCAIWMPFNHAPALFGIAAFALLVLFVGIHNAWDSVTYMTVKSLERRKKEKSTTPSASTTPQRL